MNESKEWRLIEEESWDGAMNMSLDVAAAETALEENLRTLRVYRWEPSTLSLGSNQDAETINWGYCGEEGIGVTRRPTGGGGIYHDNFGDISYSIIGPSSEFPSDLLESYKMLLEPIFDFFDRLGIKARFSDEERPAIHQPACYLRELHPAHDVVVGGKKVSGNAQYRPKNAVVQHGSIKYEIYPDKHLDLFSNPGCSSEEFKKRVTSIVDETEVERKEVVETLEESLGDWGNAYIDSWTDDELERARELCEERFGNENWTRQRKA